MTQLRSICQLMQLLHGLVDAELVGLGEARAFLFCGASTLSAILFFKRVRVAHARARTTTLVTFLCVRRLDVFFDALFGDSLELRIKPI